MRAFLLAGAVLVLFGCEPIPQERILFSGPGDFQDLAAARHQCLQEIGTVSQGNSSTDEFGQVSSNSRQLPSCGAFNGCLATKGYYRNPNGHLDATSISIDCL